MRLGMKLVGGPLDGSHLDGSIGRAEDLAEELPVSIPAVAGSYVLKDHGADEQSVWASYEWKAKEQG